MNRLERKELRKALKIYHLRRRDLMLNGWLRRRWIRKRFRRDK